MTLSAMLQPFCNHTPQVYTWRPSFGRIQHPNYKKLSCQVAWVASDRDSCACECHNPDTDAWQIQNGAFPYGWDNPIVHELIYHNKRHAQLEAERETRKELCQNLVYGFNAHVKGTIQQALNSITYIWQQKLATELIQMWHELNEEMHVIMLDDNNPNGEGWEIVYRDIRIIERVMWDNYIVRPDPVDGYLLGYCNHEWKGI